MNPRYELLRNDTRIIDTYLGKITLYRIRALTEIKTLYVNVKAGDLGGYIADEKHLLQDGTGWCFEQGEIWGGEIWGGEIRGGVIRGGVIWGGEIRGGEIWDGEIWGGVIWGGEIRGGEIKNAKDIFLVQNIGSENSRLLLVYADGKGGLLVNAGCFHGTDAEFLAAVKAKHGKSRFAKEYQMMMKLARVRILGEDL